MKAVVSVALIGFFLNVLAMTSCGNSILTSFQYYPERSGGNYDFSWAGFATPLTYPFRVTSPSGEVFTTEVNPDGGLYFQNIAKGLSAQELATRFVGKWIIDDNLSQQQSFNVTLDDLIPLPIPQIISPVVGQTLTPEFILQTSHHREQFDSTNGYVTRKTPNDQIHHIFNFYPGFNEGTLTIRARNVKWVFSHTDPIGHANRSFYLQKTWYTHSLPVTWKVVVPEPSTLALGSFALLSFAALRRRQRYEGMQSL